MKILRVIIFLLNVDQNFEFSLHECFRLHKANSIEYVNHTSPLTSADKDVKEREEKAL